MSTVTYFPLQQILKWEYMQENMTTKLLNELGGERPVQKRNLTYLEKQKRCQKIHIHSIYAHMNLHSEAFADKNMFTRPFFPCQLTVCHVFVKYGAWGTGEEAHKSHDGWKRNWPFSATRVRSISHSLDEGFDILTVWRKTHGLRVSTTHETLNRHYIRSHV